jgi:hypothetical protein
VNSTNGVVTLTASGAFTFAPGAGARRFEAGLVVLDAQVVLHVRDARDRVGDVLGELRGNHRRNAFLSRVHVPDRLHEIAGRHVLQQVPIRARRQRSVDLHIPLERRQDDDARGGKLRQNRVQRVDTADVRQPEIHQHHVGAVLAEHLNGLAPARCLRGHVHVRLAVDDGGNPLA